MQTIEVTPNETPPEQITNQANPESPTQTTQPTTVSDTSTKLTGLKVMKKKRGGARPGTGGARPGAGRPRKEYVPPATPINTRETPSHTLKLPPPPKQWFTKPEEFFTYWNSIKDPESLSRITVHVYRQWPVVDLRKLDVPGEKKSITSIDKIEGVPCPFDPNNWQQDILRHWGSGDYKMLFNEGSVNRATCINANARDMVNFPPILDYRYLCEGDPMNREFVRWARSTGRLQSEGEQREEDNMTATNESTRILAETVDRLVDKVTEQQQQAPQAPAPIPVSENSRAAIASIDMMKGTMEAMVGMIKANQSTSNPIEDAKSLIDIAKALAPASTPAPTDNATLRMMEQMMAASDKRAEEAQRRAEKLEERLNTLLMAQHAPIQTVAPKSLIDQLTELKGVRESLDGLFGGGGSSGGSDEDTGSGRGKKSTLETIANILPGLFEAGVKISGNAVQLMRAGQQQPRAVPGQPQPQYQQPQPVGQQYANLPPGMQPRPDNNQQAPPPPIQMPSQPMQQTEPQTVDGVVETESIYAQYHPFLAQIEPAFINHFENKLGGDRFAEWLVSSRRDGKLIYGQIVDAGTENLVGLLKSYPPIWSVAALIPNRFATFIDEFMAYGEDEPEDEDEGNDGKTAA